MSTSVPKVSFTIRRPSPASRATSSGADSDNNSSFKIPSIPHHLTGSNPGSPLARSANASPKRTYETLDSSSDDDKDELNDELVTGFDKFGVQRKHENKKKQQQGPLVIPALKDRDWRELARKRKALHRYVPASAKAETGADGSVGGLGTRDSINSGPQLSGIQIKQKRVKVESEEDMAEVSEVVKVEEEDAEDTEDTKAMRALLAGTNGIVPDGPIVDIILQQPITETDAYRQDVQDFPDEATLDDYARVPVSQFGAALLRGMGWKEGAPTSANGRKLVQPWLPTARPALLGIGAKEQEVYDDGSGKGKKKDGGKGRPEKRYVPLVKKEKERDGEGSGSGRDSRRTSPPSRRESAPSSRRGSRSPSPRRRHHDRDDRKRDYGKDRERGKDRDSRRGDPRDYDRDRERHRDRDGDRHERKDKRD